MGRFDIRTRSGLLSTIVQGQTASPSDGDAQAFIYRVEAAGGTLTTTEKNAVNTLVVRLKALSLWTKMKALYPMVGASAVACAQNLKSSDYTATFFGGLTYASTGVTGNGSTGYINTGLTPSTALTNANHHISFYSRTNPTPTNGVDMGVGEASNGYSSPFFRIRVDGFYGLTNTFKYDCGDVAAYADVRSTVTDSRGHFIGNILSTSNRKTYKDGVVSGTNTTPINNQLGTGPIYIFAINNMPSTPGFYTNKECAFASIGDGLTDTEAANFYNAVQEYQTAISRQIGAPAVSDADASAFIQRVYTAGGTLTTAEQNAVNQLTIDLKAASIWTAMKAVYPMVGASAAACAQNLRTGSYTGTFSGGVIYAATGVTGNGTTGYMNTGLTANTILTPANHHISYYSRNNPTPGTSVEIGAEEASSGYQGPFMRTRLTGFGDTDSFNYYVGNDNTLTAVKSTNLDSRGHFIGNILSSTNRKTYKNGSISGTLTSSLSNTLTPGNIYVLAANDAPSTPRFYSTKECAFASIGDGLTDTQAVYFNNAVETFQTSLSRNVGAIIPTVSDADAQDFVARVYGAGGTLSALEQNAVNQLVISMKAVGVWTAMKAVYPMVGASPAACAQNLKSNLYTGTFNGGWAYSSTGITGNGTNTYMNTGLVPNTELLQNSSHLAGYLRVTNSANHALLGSYLTYVLNYGYAQIHGASDNVAVNTAGQTGFFLNSRFSSAQIKQYKNNSILGTYTTNSGTPTTNPMYVGALSNGVNPANNFVNGQIAFASIGDGLTDTQESDYYSAVQAFQTTLSRQV